MSTEDAFSSFNALMRLPFTVQGAFAPNAGWNFGNVTVNYQNSKAPQVEQAIVSQVSYGRQLGRVMEALESLVNMVPADRIDQPIRDFLALAATVRKIKDRTDDARLERLREELDDLRQKDPAAWARLFA